MRSVETVIIGGGQAGLAMSWSLLDRDRDHVVLERGRIAERWRSERWDSLRLLTPNWMTRLPGYSYEGADPDGFMTKADVVDYLAGYARSFGPPVEQETTVRSVSRRDGRWRVETDRDVWMARNVVVATGHCDTPRVPPFAAGLDPEIVQVTTNRYRGPKELPTGGVLVVGASATGAQLAEEIRRSGRDVTLAVGRHNRLPREYRGRDIMWWLDRTGVLDRSVEELREPESGKHEPSLQLVGRRPGPAVDLGALRDRGIRLVGRVEGAEGRVVRLGRDLERHMAAADARLARVLARIDAYAEQHGFERPPAEHVDPVAPPDASPSRIDLKASGIRTILWATGYRRQYPWLRVPVLDAEGEIRHRRGRTPLAGLYVLGMQFQTRRRSSFIDGVGFDAEEIARAICGRPSRRCAAA
jgi:putative flavoprotein involved in K+ transport